MTEQHTFSHHELINAAISGIKNTYTPYSNFQVGAAILTNNNQVITGGNIENAAYGLCMCAERVAIFRAYAEGFTKDTLKKIAIVADTQEAVSPCGSCRQVMQELLPSSATVILSNLSQNNIKETTVKALLPYPFANLT
ncbi:cytidine deaminase [Fangia hongkongensis]|uniref:cytidine deaminase n=1 Tax=Fangia hongkongensis TaxID=270495 RepID=UPI00038112A9|nr:cytidine deaminase [Fangia hongkongensis]MBK2124774.1 cytidine deaminase [Fangia hongkongensis]